jgi:hypothetical protein
MHKTGKIYIFSGDSVHIFEQPTLFNNPLTVENTGFFNCFNRVFNNFVEISVEISEFSTIQQTFVDYEIRTAKNIVNCKYMKKSES